MCCASLKEVGRGTLFLRASETKASERILSEVRSLGHLHVYLTTDVFCRLSEEETFDFPDPMQISVKIPFAEVAPSLDNQDTLGLQLSTHTRLCFFQRYFLQKYLFWESGYPPNCTFRTCTPVLLH